MGLKIDLRGSLRSDTPFFHVTGDLKSMIARLPVRRPGSEDVRRVKADKFWALSLAVHAAGLGK